MRPAAFVCAFTLFLPVSALAQEPPPKIPLFVADVHGTVPRFPESQALADSRGLTSIAELPGAGLGLQVGAYIYPLRWRVITLGIGGEFATGRASQTPPDGSTGLVATTERFQSLGSQLSFNFGSGTGWSYISGGIGTSTWSLQPTGTAETPQDTERLKTINYGGGARWFAQPHLAFSFDVRFYAVNPGSPSLGLPGSPRATLLIIGAGVSVK
ncbi:MAG TPA: hypothetical protein VKH42_03045 [Vicinamibacterales bacterium]|nr:hypothetical protein [Vicinamibacterales bacterium]